MQSNHKLILNFRNYGSAACVAIDFLIWEVLISKISTFHIKKSILFLCVKFPIFSSTHHLYIHRKDLLHRYIRYRSFWGKSLLLFWSYMTIKLIPKLILLLKIPLIHYSFCNFKSIIHENKSLKPPISDTVSVRDIPRIYRIYNYKITSQPILQS